MYFLFDAVLFCRAQALYTLKSKENTFFYYHWLIDYTWNRATEQGESKWILNETSTCVCVCIIIQYVRVTFLCVMKKKNPFRMHFCQRVVPWWRYFRLALLCINIVMYSLLWHKDISWVTYSESNHFHRFRKLACPVSKFTAVCKLIS